MPIATTDLVLHASANRPIDDTTTSGGAIDALRRASFTQMGANAQIALVSDGADTRQVTLTGRNAAGAVITENVNLNGAVEVLSVNTYERLHAVDAASADGARTVTVKQGSGGSTLGTIPPNERGFVGTFLRSASESGAVDRYEKVFAKNAHATLTLNEAKIKLTADPSARIMIGLAASKDDSGSVANRKTPPGGVTFSDDNVDLSVPGNTLEAGSGIGVWVEQGLQAADSPFRSTYTIQIAGTSV